MTNPTFTVRARGRDITFTSAFATLRDAYFALAESDKAGGEFASSLLDTARRRALSPKQIAWLHKLATETVPQAEELAGTVDAPQLSALVELMDRAYNAQKKFPRIDLHEPMRLRLTRTSKDGTIAVTNGKPYKHKDRVWFARIERDGSVFKGRAFTQQVADVLALLASNPAHVAGQHGVATSKCCFCNTALSTAESRSVGYGPICAGKFGLPWGEVSAEVKAADAASRTLGDMPVQSLPPTGEQKAAVRQFMSVDDAIEEASERALRDREDRLAFENELYSTSDRGRADWRTRNPHRCHRS